MVKKYIYIDYTHQQIKHVIEGNCLKYDMLDNCRIILNPQWC